MTLIVNVYPEQVQADCANIVKPYKPLTNQPRSKPLPSGKTEPDERKHRERSRRSPFRNYAKRSEIV